MSFKKRNRNRNKMRPGNPGGFVQHTPRTTEQVWVDYEHLPADLPPEVLADLVASLPKPSKRGKVKEKEVESYTKLQGMSLAELHETAETENVEGVAGKKRDEVIFAIAANRLKNGTPVEVEGCLDISRDNHAFLRVTSTAYLPTVDDVYVFPSLVRQYGMQPGMTVRGRLRPPIDGEKYFGVVQIEEIDGNPPEEAATRSPFKELVPLYPLERIILEGTEENPLEMRIVDLITPIGRGQRGLIVAPPRTGKTILLQMLAKSIVKNAPDAHLIILLIDERPEEVTDFERMIPEGDREVISSTFDEPAWRTSKSPRW
jgi:transcription termination factor Rho